ncbi:MAG: DUF4082 domain-containing protein, partial [Burkholderiales bacterium]
RIFWCTQVTAHRLRALHAEDFVTTIGAQPTFDMKKTNATLIERGEFELGTGTVFINGTSCDNTTLRNIRATFGGTNMHGVFDSTCTSVVVDECELGTDSPFPAGVTSDAPITRVIKNGRWFKLHLIGGVYVATDGIESTWLQASALAASAPGSVTSAAVSQTNGTDVIATKSGVSIAGVRFYWDGSSNKTIKCRLWNPNGTGATSVNVAVTTAGIYEGYFTSPITLTPYGQYKISTWETTGAVNLYMSGAQVLTATNSAVPVASFYGKAIGNAVYRSSGFYAAGDACPVNADAADLILVDPILF